jgi:hypothetical protein
MRTGQKLAPFGLYPVLRRSSLFGCQSRGRQGVNPRQQGYVRDTCLCRAPDRHVYAEYWIMSSGLADTRKYAAVNTQAGMKE